MNKGKLAVVAILAAVVVAFFAFDLEHYLTLESFQAQRATLDAMLHAHPVAATAGFFLFYVLVTGASLPGAGILTVVAGALFGLAWGTLVVSFASSLGATIAFLSSRYVLRDWVQARYGERLKALNEGVEREGAFYLFALRLVPAFPFFLINIAMGLTPMRTATFYGVSQLGMLPGTLVFVYAGTQLAAFRLSPGLLAAFVLLGLFPLVAKRGLEAMKARRLYAQWPRPARFDRNLVVIGAGSAGLVSAYIAAAVKAKVTLIERDRMGGDCLNTGCVPSKALIRTARLAADIRRARELGLGDAHAQIDFGLAMERVQRVVRAVEPHDSAERYTKLGVECVKGHARIVSPWTVEATLPDGSKRTFHTKNIVIAAGARAFVPPIPGLAESRPLTSDNIWELRERPRRLLVLGGGPIGCELAQCFARLGCAVTQVEMGPRLLPKEDPEFSGLVAQRFRDEGIQVLTGHEAKSVRVEGDTRIVVVGHEGGEKALECDAILCAVGRMANTAGYGLEELAIEVTKQKTVHVNEFLATRFPNIFAAGDVAGPYQFTHTASHMAWYCAVNALFGRFKRYRVDYSVVPWVTFTDPEVAHVGLNETEARQKGIAHDVTVYGLDELDRAIADGAAEGRVKVLTRPGSDRILGVTIAGEHAGDILAEFVAAMKHGIGLNGILGTIHAYPTVAEANKAAAGVWRRARVTRGQMALAEAYNRWMRGDAGVGSVLAKVFALRDKRPYFTDEAAPGHGDD
ncbi:MAG TPA: FAD-dependent oxidoreductase [Usitatibacter sp.]|jgi:pyruvate/2-oxoglutarate dehydrogenase complex dihydrolipoamide dehydrogenase (E3) component/uncharacterized membrane protein YdjX (TVP38/TMEM64 family)|nr:FAD-dependent oxidoreductase [Usitatibacter sp.]